MKVILKFPNILRITAGAMHTFNFTKSNSVIVFFLYTIPMTLIQCKYIVLSQSIVDKGVLYIQLVIGIFKTT